MPSDAPTCCIVLTSADAAPASWSGTPSNAVDDSGTNTCPMPRLISNCAGTTCSAYDVDGESCGSQSMPTAAGARREAARRQDPRAVARQGACRDRRRRDDAEREGQEGNAGLQRAVVQ